MHEKNTGGYGVPIGVVAAGFAALLTFDRFMVSLANVRVPNSSFNAFMAALLLASAFVAVVVFYATRGIIRAISA